MESTSLTKYEQVVLSDGRGSLVRPFDASELLQFGIDWIKDKWEEEKGRSPYFPPFLISDIIVDIHGGTTTIYYYYQFHKDGTIVKEVWE